MKKILVIDDETITIHVIKFTLEDNPNIEIVTATDGSKAIEYLDNNVPDLIISDLVMPYKNGVDVVSYVNQKYPKVPIIVISSLASNHTSVQEVKKLNISYFIAKPLNSEVLNNCVLELLGNFIDTKEIISSNKEYISVESDSKKRTKENSNNSSEKFTKINDSIMKKSKNKEFKKIKPNEIIENLSNAEQPENESLDDQKYSKRIKKIKKIKENIEDNKDDVKMLIKMLKSDFFSEELDENSANKILKKIQKKIDNHFELINELQELEE